MLAFFNCIAARLRSEANYIILATLIWSLGKLKPQPGRMLQNLLAEQVIEINGEHPANWSECSGLASSTDILPCGCHSEHRLSVFALKPISVGSIFS